MIEVDCLVVGAGVIGLAIARALQLNGRDTFVIDAENSFGSQISSRNSEVIHAGIYYPQGSKKAFHCVRGKNLLYDYCFERDIAHRRIGKIIVACSNEESSVLDNYIKQAQANGVDDLTWLSTSELSILEPHVTAYSALMSPSTGIIDSHGYMTALLHDFENAGGHFIRACAMVDGQIGDKGVIVRLSDGTTVLAKCLVNAAGLSALRVARSIAGFPVTRLPEEYFAIGHYYALAGKSPFNHLIYPIARAGGLGVHVTLDMAGMAKFGPDIRWISDIDYAFDDSRKSEFAQAIRAYYPKLNIDDLIPGYTGIRPKISGPGQANADFVIQRDTEYEIPRVINLLGIESPGLTSSLSIAQTIQDIICAY